MFQQLLCLFYDYDAKGSSLYYESKKDGVDGFRKCPFFLFQYCIHADMESGWVGLNKSQNVLSY